VIDSITRERPLQRTAWGILAKDAATGHVLFARNPEQHFIPASNTKLVVSLVALGRFGPEYTYRTPVLLGGRSGDTAATAVVVGSGDPTWSERFHDEATAPLDSLAALIARAGVRHAGALVLDVSRFRDELVNGTWEVADLPGIYAPPIDAIAAAEGTFQLAVSGGSTAGGPGSAVAAGLLTQAVKSDLRTDTAGARTVVRIDYTARRDTIYVSGTIAAGAVDTLTRAVTQPARSAGGALEELLRRRDVTVDSVVIVRDSAAAASIRSTAQPLGEWVSAPMGEIVAVILRPSQNWVAEQVLKSLGAEFGEEGSWRGGIAVERDYLYSVAGIDSGAVNLRDGSGMSPQNLITPVSAVQMLLHARSSPWSDSFRDALAAPGLEGSTLSSRLEALDGWVFAKTHTISNVNALSGYLVAADGRDIVFSILTNGTGLPAGLVRNAMDEIALALAREVDGAAGADRITNRTGGR